MEFYSKILLYFVFILVSEKFVVKVKSDCETKAEIFCYYASWALYRIGEGQFTSDKIDPSLCTNIIYSFAGLNFDLQVSSLDPNADITLGGYSNLTALKANNPCLKTTLAVGGWNEGSIKYSIMASTEESRNAFADNVLKFIAYYGFDGIDLDWEYPTARGGISVDKENFVLLLKTIKDRISPWGFKLSIAVALETSYYDIAGIASNVDYVNLMAYDVISGDSDVTGLLSPLSFIKEKVNIWLEKGLPASKLVLGIATYARCFNLEDTNQYGIGVAVKNSTTCGGAWTDEDGFLSYYEVKSMLNNCEGSEISDDNVYAWCKDVWMTYDNEETVTTKTKYMLEAGLGGIMVWSLDTDDFLGLYSDHKYPILSSIYNTINSS